MFNKLIAIAGNTFIETIRQPIFGILTWVAVGLLLLNPSLAAFSLESGSDSKIMKDIGLSTMLLFGLFCSAFSAAGVITREIESFTVLTVVSKPVSRPVFLSGKFLGVVAALAVAYYLLTVVFMMTIRQGVMETNADKFDMPTIIFGVTAIAISLIAAGFGNFVYGWNFSTTLLAWAIPLLTLAFNAALFFDRTWKTQSWWVTDFGDWQVVFAVTMNFFAILILTAFAVTLSTRFSQTLTLIFCAAIFLLGLLSDYYFGLKSDSGPLFAALYHIVPNFQFFWVGDALTQGVLIPLEQVLRVAAYATLYSLGILGLGVTLFQTREVG
jgi:hypothetical protein